ncbi:MAG: hypothetical protein ACJ8C4_15325 [Gemmataceae bacterium]
MPAKLKDLINKWEQAYKEFEEATSKIDVERSKQLFTGTALYQSGIPKLIGSALKATAQASPTAGHRQSGGKHQSAHACAIAATIGDKVLSPKRIHGPR